MCLSFIGSFVMGKNRGLVGSGSKFAFRSLQRQKGGSIAKELDDRVRSVAPHLYDDSVYRLAARRQIGRGRILKRSRRR